MSLWRTFRVAWEGLTLNRIRSVLSTLGTAYQHRDMVPMYASIVDRVPGDDIGFATARRRARAHHAR